MLTPCGKRRQGEPIDVEWRECEYEPSSILGGGSWPKRKVHTLSLSSGQEFPIKSLSRVTRTCYVTVISGVLSLWFPDEGGGNPITSGDQAHMEFVSDQGVRDFILPPGEHNIIVGAQGGACVASIVLMDREGGG